MQWLPRISPGLRGVAVALLSLSLTGCVSGGDAYLVEGAPSGAQLKRLVLVPMNFDWTPPSQLAGGTEVLQSEVTRDQYIPDGCNSCQYSIAPKRGHEES